VKGRNFFGFPGPTGDYRTVGLPAGWFRVEPEAFVSSGFSGRWNSASPQDRWSAHLGVTAQWRRAG